MLLKSTLYIKVAYNSLWFTRVMVYIFSSFHFGLQKLIFHSGKQKFIIFKVFF